jgi:hypothetical protein
MYLKQLPRFKGKKVGHKKNAPKHDDMNWGRVFVFLAPRPGLEPGTYGLTVRRSTD